MPNTGCGIENESVHTTESTTPVCCNLLSIEMYNTRPISLPNQDLGSLGNLVMMGAAQSILGCISCHEWRRETSHSARVSAHKFSIEKPIGSLLRVHELTKTLVMTAESL